MRRRVGPGPSSVRWAARFLAQNASSGRPESARIDSPTKVTTARAGSRVKPSDGANWPNVERVITGEQRQMLVRRTCDATIRIAPATQLAQSRAHKSLAGRTTLAADSLAPTRTCTNSANCLAPSGRRVGAASATSATSSAPASATQWRHADAQRQQYDNSRSSCDARVNLQRRDVRESRA